MKTIPPFKIEEEYIDDPHWNSGFWECYITFEDGTKFTCGEAIASDEERIKDFYIRQHFDELWRGELEEKFYNEQYKKFEANYKEK